MSLITVAAAGTQTISQSETDSVAFLGAGTLNIAGTTQAPITVTLSQVAGTGVAGTINLSYATVRLYGAVGVSALVNYVIGEGGTLDVENGVSIVVGSNVKFTGTTGNLIVASTQIAPFNSISGFGPGKTIDITSAVVDHVAFTPNAGNNSGGTLTLYNSSNSVVTTISMTDGNFVTSNFHVQGDGSVGSLINFNTIVTGITASPANGYAGLNSAVTLTVGVSNPVAITGAPFLALNDGGVATYNAAASTSTQLVFNYTVGAGQNTADLAVTGVNINGATLTTIGGGGVDLSGAIANPAGTLVVDTTIPVVTSITTSPNFGYLAAGQSVALNVALSEPVNLTGAAPTLSLNDGGTAVYDAASSTASNLVFRHTVQAGQNSADLAVTGANLNGGVIADVAGNAINLASFVVNPAGILVVDTIAPSVISLTTSPVSGNLGAGQSVAFTANLSEPVSLTGGTPTLTLNDGGTAIYDAGSSTTTTLVFRHTIQSGQNSADLAVTGVSLNGATIADAARNSMNLASLIVNPAGTLVVDTLAPTVASVSTSPVSGALAAGQTVAVNVALSEAVSVAGGTPTLALDDGGTAIYDPSTSTPTNLVFRYVVQPGQNTADLSVTGANLGGATIADATGNLLGLGGAIGNPAGILAIDTTAPTVVSVSTSPGSGAVVAGQTVAINVGISEAVNLTGGTPTLTLNTGGTAVYDAASSTPTNLVFDYTVQAGQNTSDLTITAANLGGATIADQAGNLLGLSGAVGNPPGTLTIDTNSPAVASVVTNPGSGDLAAGQAVAFNVALNKAITLSGGIPTLTLNDGGTATYDAASSTATNLVFRYTVQAGQNTGDLTIVAASLNGATITDQTGNAIILSSFAVNPAGILAVDTTAPIVAAVSASPGSGTANVGQTVAIAVAVSEAVNVAGGIPTLTLNDGGTATYDAASSTPTNLVFRHTVQAGQNASDLAITAANLNNATIADLAGNPLSLSGLVGNPPGVLIINGTTPAVLGVTTTPGSGTVTPGDSVSFNVSLNDPVVVSGGVPVLALSDGGYATYDPSKSTPTNLVFTTTIQTGQTSPDLTVTGYDLHGSSIADASGQVLSLNGAVVNPPGILDVATAASGTTGISNTISIYRFFDSRTGTHFYTPDAGERDTILKSRPDLIAEGTDGVGLRAVNPASNDPDAAEVFRFFDTVHGTQFLTASTVERDTLLATRHDLTFEPDGSFYEHSQPLATDTPVYRFFSSADGTHFYTDSASERASILQTRPDLIAEGIGFYEPS